MPARSSRKTRSARWFATTCLGAFAAGAVAGCIDDAGDAPLPGEAEASTSAAEIAAASPKTGRPTFLIGTLAGPAATGDAAAVIAAVAPHLGIPAAELSLRSVEIDDLGSKHYRFWRSVGGIPVLAEVRAHVDADGVLYAAHGDPIDTTGLSLAVRVSSAAAVARAQGADASVSKARATPSRLVVVADADEHARLAWEVDVRGHRNGLPVNDRVHVDAQAGDIVGREARVHSALNRRVFTADNGTALPGRELRNEGGPVSTDGTVNLNFSHLGAAYGCFNALYERDSFDNGGGRLDSVVHFENAYNNAFWDGTRLVFGDGDGTRFASLARDRDIVVHELGHGVTEHTARLVYRHESGALNESMSDVFAAICAWQISGAVDADTWKLGEAAYTPNVTGDALRYLADPAAAGDTDYFPTRPVGPYGDHRDDNGYVHSNSGIANLAFFLASQGGLHPRGRTQIQVPAIGIDRTAQIWYRALRLYMTSSTDFQAARAATMRAARDVYGDGVALSVETAWRAVGVPGAHGVAYDRGPGEVLAGWCGHAGSTFGSADFDGDRQLDLWCHDPMVAGSPGRTWVALAKADGTGYEGAAGATLFDPWLSNWCGSLGEIFGVADFTGDGKADLYCRDANTWGSQGRTFVAVSTGTSFVGAAGGGIYTPWLANWCGTPGEQFGVADFNGDRKADIFCHEAQAASQGRTWVALSSGTRFQAPSGGDVFAPWVSNWCGGASVGTMDIDGDRDADLWCHETNGGTSARLWILQSTGSGFAPRPGRTIYDSWLLGWCGEAGAGFGIGDFNGDGKDDTYCKDPMAAGSPGRVRVTISTGTSFEIGGNVPWISNWCGHPGASFGTGHFNGDDKADILCKDSQHIWIALSNGEGGFYGDPWDPKLSNWCTVEQLSLTKLDTDAAADLLCHEPSGPNSTGRTWVGLTRYW